METLGLIKFGARVHMQQLIDEGLLYFQTIEHFRQLERDQLRGDSSEGLTNFYHPPLIELQFTNEAGESIKFSGKDGTLAGPVRISTDQVTGLHVFCLYAITGRNPASMYIDPSNFAFGDTCVMIYDSETFLRRVMAALRTTGFWAKVDLVEYVDRNVHSGGMGPFRKFREFEKQSEFRIALATRKTGPFIVRVGSLHDVAELKEASKVNEMLTLGHNLLTA
jgi:hypothetical protein